MIWISAIPRGHGTMKHSTIFQSRPTMITCNGVFRADRYARGGAARQWLRRMIILPLVLIAFRRGDAPAQPWRPIASPADPTNYSAAFTDSLNGVITNWSFSGSGSSAEIY